jgi:outer membrane protein assembly factor BamD
MKRARAVIAVALALALLGLGGCGWIKGFGKSGSDKGDVLDVPAQVLANEAEQSYKEGNYEEAADLFQQLKDRYPYSRYGLLADLRVGDAYAKAKRWDEAALAYEDFIRLHPKNEAVPYALYQMGMVYHQQMLTADRDPNLSRKATETFQRLLREFPNDEWAVKAQPRLKESLERLAGHDMSVGDFYYRTKRYEAAIGRYKRVLTQYPDVGLYNEAMEGIRKAQLALDAMPEEERNKRRDERRDLLVAPPNVETPQVIFESERRGGGPF